ncbi:hypothetical protein CEP51_005814 [Fusarium floridanum]|uniref:Uncharacterized protein n=1 Tax=Fusarium floridanum TaxID=1325733 RepID=A0A428RV61_9HYPO|nr:hypothetical protein CEP51_005814 [Fusarium floridanum]
MALPPQQLLANESVAAFKRIQIFNQGDHDSLFPLIVAYAEQPSLADSVEELAIDSAGWRWRSMDPSVAPYPISYAVYAMVESRVRSLGLGPIEGDVLDALASKRRALEEKPDPQQFLMCGVDDRELRHGFPAAAAVIILAMCKNISTLYLGDLIVPWGRYHIPHSMVGAYLEAMRLGQVPQPSLQKLKRVEMIEGRNGAFSGYGRATFTAPFFFFNQLPEFKELVADAVEEYQVEALPVEPGSSNVDKIEITHSNVYTKTMVTILKAPRALREFTLWLGGMSNRDGSSCWVVTKEIGEALATQKETLEKLDLDLSMGSDSDSPWPDLKEGQKPWPESLTDPNDVKEDEEYEDEDEEEDNEADKPRRIFYSGPTGTTLGSLADYHALKHLSINPGTLLTPTERGINYLRPLKSKPARRLINLLPPNIESLCLYGYVKGESRLMDKQVKELMEKKGERLPKLKEVRGVEETVPDMHDLYGEKRDENYLVVRKDGQYKRPKRDFGWLRV